MVTAPDVLSVKKLRPAQRPGIDVEMTSKVGRSKNLVSILKRHSKAIDRAGCSKNYLLVLYVCLSCTVS